MAEQERREKVINGLEHELQNRGKCGHYCRDGKETVSCEYDKDGLCIQHWGNDALALLKAQEPVLAVKLQSKKYIGRTGIAYDGSCGNCNTYLMRAWRACPLCGKVVKWIG